MIKAIPIVVSYYEKQGSKWVLTEKQNKVVNEEYVNNIITARKFFTGLGGYERQEKNYTKYGFRVIRVVGISPMKDKKVIYEFDFDNAD